MAVRRNSTEATVKKVAMTSDIKVGEPLEPEKVIEYDCPNVEITDQKEAFGYVLKISGYEWTIEDYFKEKNLDIWTNANWESLVMDRGWRVYKNLIRDFLQEHYVWQYAYLKKWDSELYWRVQLRPYDSLMKSPYGVIHMPLMTVDNVPIFFPMNKLLTREQVSTYELYNWKQEDFDRVELEKKIMADLITYSQLWVKNITNAKDIFDRIQKECEKIWTVSGLRFDNWILNIRFDWRMLVDSSWTYWPLAAPPFTIMVDFRNKEISWDWEHPHNLHPDLCLGWELTRLKDKCFKDRDIYWLAMWLVQFWNQWTSTDAGHTSRDVPHCVLRYLQTIPADTCINEWALPVSLASIVQSLAEMWQQSYFLNVGSTARRMFINRLEEESFVLELKEKIGHDNLKELFSCAYVWGVDDNPEKYEAMCTKYLS